MLPFELDWQSAIQQHTCVWNCRGLMMWTSSSRNSGTSVAVFVMVASKPSSSTQFPANRQMVSNACAITAHCCCGEQRVDNDESRLPKPRRPWCSMRDQRSSREGGLKKLCTCSGFGQCHPVARLVHPHVGDLRHGAVLLVLRRICLTQHPHLPQHACTLDLCVAHVPSCHELFDQCLRVQHSNLTRASRVSSHMSTSSVQAMQ